MSPVSSTPVTEEGVANRSRPRRSPAARPTDDQLLGAARMVFAERGYAQATMEAIAEAADSTKPTLYAHFGDKAALYRAVFGREVEALRDWLLRAYEEAAGLPLAQQVRGYVMALFRYATAHADSFRILFDQHGADELDPVRMSIVDTISDRVAEQIRRYLTELGREPGPSVRLLAEMLVGLVGGAARHVRRTKDLDPVVAGELATTFIMAALTNLDHSLLDPIDHPAR